MAFTAPVNDFEREIPPEGWHVARCIHLIDLGTIPDTFDGRSYDRRRLRLTWELVLTARATGEFAGSPFFIGKTYTLSLSRNAELRKDLDRWRGAPFTEEAAAAFDLLKLLNVPAWIRVEHYTPKGRSEAAAGVAEILPPPPGQKVPELSGKTLALTLAAFDPAAWARVPAAWQREVRRSREWPKVAHLVPQEPEPPASGPPLTPPPVPPPPRAPETAF
jgi:hypothetical protein